MVTKFSRQKFVEIKLCCLIILYVDDYKGFGVEGFPRNK